MALGSLDAMVAGTDVEPPTRQVAWETASRPLDYRITECVSMSLLMLRC